MSEREDPDLIPYMEAVPGGLYLDVKGKFVESTLPFLVLGVYPEKLEVLIGENKGFIYPVMTTEKRTAFKKCLRRIA